MGNTFIPERGDQSELYSAGRGYQAPALPGTPMPPSWNMDPHTGGGGDEGAAIIVGNDNAPPLIAGTDAPLREASIKEIDDIYRMVMQQERATPSSPTVPQSTQEHINLENNTAMFRRHLIQLSPEARDTINIILVREVMRTLEEEMERVAQSVLNETVLPTGDSWQDMREVPGAQGAVGTPQSSGSPKVLRVRKQKAAGKSKNVRKLPGAEGGKT